MLVLLSLSSISESVSMPGVVEGESNESDSFDPEQPATNAATTISKVDKRTGRKEVKFGRFILFETT